MSRRRRNVTGMSQLRHILISSLWARRGWNRITVALTIQPVATLQTVTYKDGKRDPDDTSLPCKEALRIFTIIEQQPSVYLEITRNIGTGKDSGGSREENGEDAEEIFLFRKRRSEVLLKQFAWNVFLQDEGDHINSELDQNGITTDVFVKGYQQ